MHFETHPAKLLLDRISIIPQGVPGTQLQETGGTVSVGSEPEPRTVIVDPAGPRYISNDGPAGASNVIYEWLGISGIS